MYQMRKKSGTLEELLNGLEVYTQFGDVPEAGLLLDDLPSWVTAAIANARIEVVTWFNPLFWGTPETVDVFLTASAIADADLNERLTLWKQRERDGAYQTFCQAAQEAIWAHVQRHPRYSKIDSIMRYHNLQFRA